MFDMFFAVRCYGRLGTIEVAILLHILVGDTPFQVVECRSFIHQKWDDSIVGRYLHPTIGTMVQR